MKINKKKKAITSEYRVLNSSGVFSIIQVFYNGKGKLVGYTDFIIPSEKDIYSLKLLLSSMISSTRKKALTDKDLKSIKH